MCRLKTIHYSCLIPHNATSTNHREKKIRVTVLITGEVGKYLAEPIEDSTYYMIGTSTSHRQFTDFTPRDKQSIKRW